MFSRRHPHLFFILTFFAIFFGGIITLSVIFSIGGKRHEFISGDKIGIIELTGVITNSKEIISDLKTFSDDNSIKAIVLRIDSPGGGVAPSQEIFREIRKTIKTKKVIASMGSVAASGGYYVASATSGSIANPGTITGSIGVIMGYTDFQEIFNKIGLKSIIIKSGDYKDLGSPARKMTEKEKEFLQQFVDKIHIQFVKDVSSGRNMDIEKIKSLADGRIFTGEEAKELELVDRLGNLQDAIEWAGKMVGIEGKINFTYPKRVKYSFLKELVESSIYNLSNHLINPSFTADYIYRPGK